MTVTLAHYAAQLCAGLAIAGCIIAAVQLTLAYLAGSHPRPTRKYRRY